MKKILSLMLVFMLLLSSIASLQVVNADDIPWGETQTVDSVAVADTYVSAKTGETSSNFGLSEEFDVSGASTGKNYAYLVIDASDWQIARLDSAKLRLYGLTVSKSNLNVYRIDNKMWDQKSITYLSRPSDAGKTLIGTMAISGSSLNWFELDITQALANEPDKILSLCIEAADTKSNKFASTENTDKTLAPRVTITGAKPDGDIKVESVSLDRASMAFVNGLDTGSSLKASINPAYATNRDVNWTSSDESVATVDGSGFVTPGSVGTAFITATSAADPTKFAQCKVSVLSVSEAGGVKTSLIPSDDTIATGAYAGNHGGEKTLPMRSVKNNQNRQIYMKFKYPEIAGYEVLSAKVYMYCLDSLSDPLGLPVTPYGIFGNDTWSEMSVTEAAAKRPETQADITPPPTMTPYANNTTRIYEPSKWYSWDVTQYAKEKGNGIYSIKFSNDDYGTPPYQDPANPNSTIYLDQFQFSSKEGSYAPYMEIVARPYGIKSSAGKNLIYTSLSNSDPKNTKPVALMAINYDANGNMSSIAADKYDVLPTSSQNFSVTMPKLEDEINGYTKFLLWDDVKKALPLRIAQKFYEGGPEYVPTTHPEANGVSIDGNKLTVKGETTINSNVGYALFKPGAYEADLDYKNLQASLAQIDQKISDEKGNYEFTYNIPSGMEDGIYTVVVSNGNNDDGNLVSPSTFRYIKPVNVNENYLAQELKNATDILGVQQILYPYAKALNLGSSKLYTKYFYALPSDKKAELLNQMMLTFDTSSSTVAHTVNEIIGLYTIKAQTNYDNMTNVMKDSMAEFEISSADQNLLKSDSALMRYVTQRVYGLEFTSLGKFDEKVDDLIAEYTSQNDNDSHQSSGGGGHSGSTIKVAPVIIPSITPSPTPTPTVKPVEVKFNDLTNYGWAKDSIVKLATAKVVNGRDEYTFAPADNVTREEFVKMIILAFGLENSGDQCSFKDVDKNDWSYSYIATAAKLGIVKGNEDNTFGIRQNISRQDMAAMVYRAAGIAGLNLAEKNAAIEFKDNNKIDNYALEAVTKMQKAGIITGLEDGSFNPLGLADRAESAVIISRLLEN